MKEFSKMNNLKNAIKDTIRNPASQLPCEFFFHEGFEKPKYKITIEAIQQDFFIDSNGVKWVRQPS